MMASVKIPKPTRKMKTVVNQLEQCLYFNGCQKCWLKKYSNCQQLLMADGLWYLKQTLEKSEGKGK